MKVGQSLREKIGKAILGMDYFAVFLSKNSLKSEWVKKELEIALDKELKRKKVVVLPVLLERVNVPPFLRGKLYVDFSSPRKFEQSLYTLINSLGISKHDVRDKRNSDFIWHELHHYIQIMDIKGRNTLWIKKTIATPIRNDVSMWIDDQVHSDGKLIFKSTNMGSIVDISRDGATYSAVTSFSKALPEGKRITKTIDIQVLNGYNERTCSISWIPIGDFEKLAFHIKVPIARPIKGVPESFCYFGTSKTRMAGSRLNRNRNLLNWTIKKPQAGIKYLLIWQW